MGPATKRGVRKLFNFGVGLAIVFIAVMFFRSLCLGGISQLINYYRHFLDFCGWQSGLSHQASKGAFVSSTLDRVANLSDWFGGWRAAVVVAIGVIASILSLLDPNIETRFKRFGLLILACSVLIFVHWFFIDPFGWARRVVPALCCVLGGFGLFVSVGRSKVLKVLFTLGLISISWHNHYYWNQFLNPSTAPTKNLRSFLDSTKTFNDLKQRRDLRIVTSAQWYPLPMFQSVIPETLDPNWRTAPTGSSWLCVSDARWIYDDKWIDACPHAKIELEEDPFTIRSCHQ